MYNTRMFVCIPAWSGMIHKHTVVCISKIRKAPDGSPICVPYQKRSDIPYGLLVQNVIPYHYPWGPDDVADGGMCDIILEGITYHMRKWPIGTRIGIGKAGQLIKTRGKTTHIGTVVKTNKSSCEIYINFLGI